MSHITVLISYKSTWNHVPQTSQLKREVIYDVYTYIQYRLYPYRDQLSTYMLVLLKTIFSLYYNPNLTAYNYKVYKKQVVELRSRRHYQRVGTMYRIWVVVSYVTNTLNIKIVIATIYVWFEPLGFYILCSILWYSINGLLTTT